MTEAVLIDTHCHLDFEQFDEDRPAVLQRARDAGLVAIINPGVDLASSAAVCDLAAAEPLVYAAVGIHPTSAGEYAAVPVDALRMLARREKVVAVGEIGLDYYWDRTPKDVQHRALAAQLTLAASLELPVIIHNRDATEDLLEMLADWVQGLPEGHPQRERPGVLHSFSAGVEDAQRALALGFYIGITGPVTFKNADLLRRVVAAVPQDRLLVETDAPFLTPIPHRGRRNEPAYVRYVADRIAGVRLTELAAVAEQTTRNARRLFGLPLAV